VEPTTYSSLHHAVAFLERRAVTEWMQQYSLGTDLELVLAEHGKSITVCYERRQGSSVSVTVSIECHRPALNQSSYFVLQRAGNRQYVDAPTVSPAASE
jgi:hypothetical protein